MVLVLGGSVRAALRAASARDRGPARQNQRRRARLGGRAGLIDIVDVNFDSQRMRQCVLDVSRSLLLNFVRRL